MTSLSFRQAFQPARSPAGLEEIVSGPGGDFADEFPHEVVEGAEEGVVEAAGVEEGGPAEAAAGADEDGAGAGEAAGVPPVVRRVDRPALGVAGVGGGGR